MKLHQTGKLAVLAGVAASFTFISPVFAASPDGFGPWSDGIAVVTQGLRKDGSPVLPERSDAAAALGLAEGTLDMGTFFSLGFGGSSTFTFQNGISEGTFVVESTYDDFYYPAETAKVEISVNGLSYQEIGTVTKEHGEVKIPDNFGCALFVRVTDTSNLALYEGTADGYDVDGVRSVGAPCVTGGEIPACFAVTSSQAQKSDKAISQLKSIKAEKYQKIASKVMSRRAR